MSAGKSCGCHHEKEKQREESVKPAQCDESTAYCAGLSVANVCDSSKVRLYDNTGRYLPLYLWQPLNSVRSRASLPFFTTDNSVAAKEMYRLVFPAFSYPLYVLQDTSMFVREYGW